MGLVPPFFSVPEMAVEYLSMYGRITNLLLCVEIEIPPKI